MFGSVGRTRLSLIGRYKRGFSTQIYNSVDECVADIQDNSTVLVGGFGLCGIPENLIQGLKRKNAKDLTCVSNNCGVDDFGLGILLANGQIKKMISSYVGENKIFEKLYLTGKLEVELTPQGTLAQKLASGGQGVPGFYTPTGVGTWVESGGMPIKYNESGEPIISSPPKETKMFNGRKYLLEDSINGDFALIKGYKADTSGNIIFKDSAMNFNPQCAKAGTICIAEVEEIVPVGELDPDAIHLPGIYVHRLVQGESYEKRIERKTVYNPEPKLNPARTRIVRRAAQEINPGNYVNLGIGLPTQIVNFLDPEAVHFHSENGVLGFRYPLENEIDPDKINAGKETIGFVKSTSVFSSAESFGMIRSGKLDLTILGSLQIAPNGDIANWIIPGKMVKGMGGAMDLVSCGSRVVVTMEHVAKGGAHKILEACTLPLTGQACVDRVITDLGVFDVDKVGGTGLTLIEIAPEVSVEDIKAATGCPFKVADDLKQME